MGKKAKLGKRRRDKFYHLAKETGYRARSAFKLIQLNRKFNFLQESRVLIDLCAAPGGWLQVASNHMPVSSVIIGVDLVKIKPIHNVISLQADITTPQCRQLLQKELKTWKADCVLNDGAPNVGSSWLQDAFTQSELTLSAVKLATEFLRPGGSFITKVFRSRDYQPLLQTFQQLFRKVHATKPQASRSESAEIFVVCQGYKFTKKPDPKLLDPKFVFAERTDLEKQPVSLQNIQKPPKSAEGYGDDQHILFKSSSVLDFISCDDHLTMLAKTHQLVFDKASEVFVKHPETNSEIVESCKDIKVLGLKELKMLIKWRKKMREFIDNVEDDVAKQSQGEDDNDKEEDMELEELDKKVEEMMKEERSELKSAIKRKKKMVKKATERAQAHKETHREVEELIADKAKTFSLKSIKNRRQLNKLEKGVVYSDSEPEDDSPPSLVDPLEREQSEDEEGAELGDEGEEPLEWETFDGGDTPSDNDSIEQDEEDAEIPVAKKVRKLDPEGLAIGALMVASKKKRTELLDSGYNKWSHNDDDNLPDWFVEDESQHCRKQLPITKEMVEEYKKKLKEINARPIKKIAEAKARKKQRSLKKLEGVRKRAQVICDNADVTDHEKAHTIRNIYKKAGFLGQKKEEVKYVVAKKGVGKRVRRPKGVTGRFKVVDPRMKKDKRANKKQQQKNRKSSKGRR